MSAHESDVVNLAAPAVRRPGRPLARHRGLERSRRRPREHGRPLRPRQVRAGVPRPLDAICERVLNAGPHPHVLPIETAHEIYAALSDYIGDPRGAPQFEATAVHGRPTPPLAADRPATRPGDPPEPRRRDAGDGGGATRTPTTSRRRRVALCRHRSTAEDAGRPRTQAGVPMFFDEDTGVGWMSAPSHGSSHGASPTTPPPPTPTQPDRPPSPTAVGGTPPRPPAGRRGPTRPGPRGRRLADARRPRRQRRHGRRPSSTRPPVGRSSPARTGTARVPAAWGPDADEPPPHDPRRLARRPTSGVPGRSWLRLAVVLAAVVVLVVGGRLRVQPRPRLRRRARRPRPPRPRLALAVGAREQARCRSPAVTDFDPEGDPPEENPDLAPLAVDGKPATAWQTSTVLPEPPAALKSGVGLLVDLGKPTQVGSVRLDAARRRHLPGAAGRAGRARPPRPAPTGSTPWPRRRTPAPGST